jgi:hypothetical protein
LSERSGFGRGVFVCGGVIVNVSMNLINVSLKIVNVPINLINVSLKMINVPAQSPIPLQDLSENVNALLICRFICGILYP